MIDITTKSLNLLRNVSITTVCHGFGVAAGLVLDACILFYFGMGKTTDAFFAAITLPLILVSTIEVQAPKVIIPFLADAFWTKGKAWTWELINKLIGVSVAILVFLCVIGSGLAGTLIRFQIPGFEMEWVRLAGRLSSILFWLLLLRGLGAVLQSVLYALHFYFVASIGKLVYNCGTIFCVYIMQKSIGIYALAVGYLVGSFLELLLFAVVILKSGFRYRIVMRFRDPDILKLSKLFIYPLLAHMLGEAKVLLENFVASFLSGGSVSALRYASRIVQALAGVLVGSITTATLPIVSHHAASGDIVGLKSSLLQSIKMLLFISLFVGIWLVFTSKEMLVLLFVRGEFSLGDAALVSVLICLMIPYILFSRLVGIYQTPFYGSLDTKTPLLSSLIIVLLNVGVALGLFLVVGIYAFPIASSVGCIGGWVYLAWFFAHRFGAIGCEKLYSFSYRLAAAGFLSAIGFVLTSQLSWDFVKQEVLKRGLGFGVPSTIGALAFVVASIGLGAVGWKAMREIGWKKGGGSSTL